MQTSNPSEKSDWQPACVDLWGERWSPSLADVLGVSTRTIDFWRAGEVDIPEALAADLVRLAACTSTPRIYGDMLRQVSRGRDLDTLTNILAKIRADDPLSQLQSKLRRQAFVARRSRDDVQTAAPAL